MRNNSSMVQNHLVLTTCKHLEVSGLPHTYQCLTQLLFGSLLLLQPLHQFLLRAGSILIAGDHGAASDLHMSLQLLSIS